MVHNSYKGAPIQATIEIAKKEFEAGARDAKTIWRRRPEQKWISGHRAQVSEIVCSPDENAKSTEEVFLLPIAKKNITKLTKEGVFLLHVAK